MAQPARSARGGSRPLMLRFAPRSLDPLLHPPRHPAHHARPPHPHAAPPPPPPHAAPPPPPAAAAAALRVGGKRPLAEALPSPAGAEPVPGRLSAAAMLASAPVAQPVQLRAEQPVTDPDAVRRA